MVNQGIDIGGGYRRVSAAAGRRINGGALPGAGREALVYVNGGWHWLAPTRDAGATVWAIRPAPGWRMVNGSATRG